MKIVHISSSDAGGAGFACIRLHKELLTLGIDSSVLVLSKFTNTESVYQFKHRSKLIYNTKKILKKILPYYNKTTKYQYITNHIKTKYNIFFSTPLSQFDLTQNDIVKNADLIHLHWVADFIDYPTFFKRMKKPIIWTFHDQNPLMGGFHTRISRDLFYDKISIIEEKFNKIKLDSLKKSNLFCIICPSKEQQLLVNNHIFFKQIRAIVINNSIDTIIFKIHNKQICREILDLPLEKKILLFIANDINDRFKGFQDLITSLEEISNDELFLCVVGANNRQQNKKLKSIRFLGTINDQQLLAVVYNACDILVTPSFEESFGQTITEAMACGIPVLSYPNGGSKEQIDADNGIITAEATVEALTKGIRKILDISFNSNLIRNKVMTKYNAPKIANQIYELYDKTINNNYKLKQ